MQRLFLWSLISAAAVSAAKVGEAPDEDANNLVAPGRWARSINTGRRGATIGVCGEAGIYGNKHNDILIAIILMMIFAEALALYGFIIAIVLVMSS